MGLSPRVILGCVPALPHLISPSFSFSVAPRFRPVTFFLSFPVVDIDMDVDTDIAPGGRPSSGQCLSLFSRLSITLITRLQSLLPLHPRLRMLPTSPGAAVCSFLCLSNSPYSFLLSRSRSSDGLRRSSPSTTVRSTVQTRTRSHRRQRRDWQGFRFRRRRERRRIARRRRK